MLVFMAGAMSTGARVARYSADRKSSAMPCANLPRMLAVAGATSSRSMLRRERDVLDVGVQPGRELAGDDRLARDRLERQRPDEPPRRPRHHRLHAMSALLQQARDFDGLVGADAAGDAEPDEGHALPTACLGRAARRARTQP